MTERMKFDKNVFKDIVYSIPEKYFKSNTTTFADLQAANCQIIILVVERLRSFGHSDENIKGRVFAFSENEMYKSIVEYRNKTLPIVYNLYNELDLLNMKFDVIVGNPPYQNGQDKFFFGKFIEKANTILKPNGVLTFINPYSWVNKSLFNRMKKDGYFHYLQQEDGFELFNISMGNPLCTFLYEKDSNIKGCADIKIHPKWAKDPKALSIIYKIFDNSIKPKKGKGQPGFLDSKDNTYKHPIYLSSKNTPDDNRTCKWSDSPGVGSNISKFIVAHILEPGKCDQFSEFSKEKGVGRYSYYFECTKENSENIKLFFNSDVYKFVDNTMRSGRYAYLEIPNIDWSIKYDDSLIYQKLTTEEIDYIKNAVK